MAPTACAYTQALFHSTVDDWTIGSEVTGAREEHEYGVNTATRSTKHEHTHHEREIEASVETVT